MQYETKPINPSCLVLLSGGQDSTTCLIWAMDEFERVRCITFDYDQKHRVEIECAQQIAERCGVPIFVQKITPPYARSSLISMSETDKQSYKQKQNTLPSSFVPCRNYILLGYAAAYAYMLDIEDLVIGASQTDYSGYPDCRQYTLDTISAALTNSLDSLINIHAPLMFMTKAETIKLMQHKGALHLYAYTNTCYAPRGQIPCMICPACKLRIKGFKDADIADPLIVKCSYLKNLRVDPKPEG